MSTSSTTNICFFFAYNGQCSSGDQCTFVHDAQDAPSTKTFNHTHSASNGDSKSVDVHAVVLSAEGASNEEGNPRRRNTCYFWKKGKCNKGKQCEYAHFEPSSPSKDEDIAQVSQQTNSRSIDQETYDDVKHNQTSDACVEPQPGQAYDNGSKKEEQAAIDAEPGWNASHDQAKSLAIDDQTREAEDLDHLEGQGDISMETITPDDHAQESDTPDGQREGQINAFSNEDNQLDTTNDNQVSQETQGDGHTDEEEEIRVPHWTEYADPYTDPFIAFCKFFARGRCNKGELCPFRHALTVQEHFLLFRLEPFMWSPQLHALEETIQAPAPVQPPPPVQPPSSTVACVFYPLGKCRNGKKCPYSHVDPPDSSQGDQNEQAYVEDNYNWKAEERRPCRYIINYGSCRIGKDCKFSHEMEHSYPSWHNGEDRLSTWNNAEDNCSSWNNAEDNHSSWQNTEDTQPSQSVDSTAQDSADVNTEDTQPSQSVGSTAQDSADVENSEGWSAESKIVANVGEGDRETNQWESKGLGENADGQDDSTRKSANDSGGGEDQGSSDDNGWGESTAKTWTKYDTRTVTTRISSRQDAPRYSSGRKAICRLYLGGECHWSPCRFAHESDDAEHNSWNDDDWTTKNSHPVKNTPLSKYKGNVDGTMHNQQGADGQNSIEEPSNTWNSRDCDADTWFADSGRQSSADAWQTDYDSSYAASGHRRMPCKFFGQGYCAKGDSCSLLHVHPEDLNGGENEINWEDQETEDKELQVYNDDATAERSMYNCAVLFGAAGHVKHALTATDPNRIILRNLPSNILREQLADLPVEGLHTVHIHAKTEQKYASLEFGTQQQTLRALEALNNYQIQGSTLSAHLYADQMDDCDSAALNCKVKVTWPAPRTTAWARYKSVTSAKEDASRLDGQIVEGRRIRASYLPAKRGQANMFAVRIDNLPPGCSEASVKRSCTECQLVNMASPTYTSSPVEQIKKILSQYGDLATFDILNLPPSDEVIAFAEFGKPEAAKAAAEFMQKLGVDFLGAGGIVKVEGVHHSQFDVQSEQFRRVEGDLEKLRGVFSKECFIVVVSCDGAVSIHAYAPLEEASAFARFLASLNTLIYGEVLKQDGARVWDDYFDSPSSTKVIETINAENAKEYNVLIVPDNRAQRILILGEQVNRPRAREHVLKVLKKVRMAWNEIPFDRLFVRWYLEQGKDLIQSEPDIGKNKVSLDLIDPKIIVRGDSKVLKKVKEMISNAVTIRRDGLDDHSVDVCHICLGKPDSPIALSCKHIYCKECLSMLLGSAVENIHTPLKCIAKIEVDKQCNQDIPYMAMRDLLTTADEEQLLRAHFMTYVRSGRGGLFFCPSLQCGAVHRSNDVGVKMLCLSCMAKICLSCQTHYHVGATCDEWRKMISA
ncbi:hypothetical protein APHAL10511_004429 [Amanita phalloides]|nr:hypothetical protein APHAL10511_004429 [Amanita phalloides]